MANKHSLNHQIRRSKAQMMDCSKCADVIKHCLELSQRTYFCDVCGLVSSRDNNSAAVMVGRAGFNPAGVDGIRPGCPLGTQAA